MSSTVAAPAGSPVETRDGPYQGLVPFREEDAPYFRGRAREVEIIVANLRSRRTTILYGPSGVGKSSVLGAGLLPRLRALAEQDRRDRDARPAGDGPERAMLAYCLVESWRDEPLAALAAAMHRAAEDAAGAPLEPWTPGASLADAVRGWRRSVRRFLVILDQFEDYFLYHPGAEGEFADTLVELMTAPDLPVNVLVSLREDAHARLDRFADDVPELYSHQIRLEHLDRAGAEQAIGGPIEEHNRRHDEDVEVEEGLVTALLDRAGGLRVAGTVSAASAGGDGHRGQGIEASYLQLVLTRLWQEEVRHPPTRLRAATLERLGGPEAIVKRHVEETLAEPGLTPREQEVAAALFEFLVTPSRTKFAQSVGDLAVLTKRDPAEIQAVIDKLTDRERRLLRVREPVPGVADAPSRVEIYHDALATPILAWRDRIAERVAARDRRRRLVLWGGLAVVIVAGLAVLAIAAFLQRQEANRESAAARSQALAASSQSTLAAQPDLGLALALAAVDAKPTVIAEAQLRGAVASSPGLRVIGIDDSPARVAFSRDGRSFAGAGADGTVRVWDAVTGQVQTLQGHDGSVLAVAFSPDSRTVASSGEDGTVRIWDPASGDELQTLEGHDGPVFGVAFSPGGDTIASSGKDGTVRIWDTASGDALRTLEGHHRGVRGVAFSPDGGTLASAGADSTVRLWDPASGDALTILRGHDGPVNAVAFSPGGGALATAGDDDTVRLWDRASGTERGDPFYGHDGRVNDVVFGAGGRVVASVGDDGTVLIWDSASGDRLRRLTGHVGSVLGIAISPDGRTLASVGDDETVRLWDPAAGDPLLTTGGHDGLLLGVASSPDGRTLATAGEDGTVRLWDATSGTQRGEPLTGHEGPVNGVAFRPDGRTLASGGEDGTVRIWDTASGDAVRTLRGHESGVLGVAFRPDGGMLASASDDGTMRLWDAATGDALRTLEGHTAAVNGIAFSPDGKRLASGSDDGTVRTWDTYSGEPEQTLLGHVAGVLAVAYSPDGLTLASASDDDTVRLWDTSSERTLWTLAGPEGSVNGIAFSPDGRTLASAGDDGTVRYWDPASGRALTMLDGNGSALLDVAFRPDDTLATAGDDGTLRIYACRACLTPEEIEETARSLRASDLTPEERDLYGVGG